jgi:hypothetical protein
MRIECANNDILSTTQGVNMIGKLISVMFNSRDVAHKEHLRTGSYAQHKALGSFYKDIVGLADSIAEAYQGRHGIIKDIPKSSGSEMGSIDKVLESHLSSIENMRYTVCDRKESAIQNMIDEVVALYLSTLYKLRNLK